MTLTIATGPFDWRRWRLSRSELARGLMAGAAWGIAMTVGLTAMTAVRCGGVCLPEIAINGTLSLAAGIAGIGPIAAYGARPALRGVE